MRQGEKKIDRKTYRDRDEGVQSLHSSSGLCGRLRRSSQMLKEKTAMSSTAGIGTGDG